MGFGIGAAIELMREGMRVHRKGWNGKGMYLAYQPGYPDGIPINANTAKATGQPEGTVLRFLPYVTMRTADGSFVPWLCSQTDLLADDYEVKVDGAQDVLALEPQRVKVEIDRSDFQWLAQAIMTGKPMGALPGGLFRAVLAAAAADTQRLAAENAVLESGTKAD